MRESSTEACGKLVLKNAGTRYSRDAFTAGFVLHTGPHAFPISDPVTAAPVSALWTP
jgi:hypothetical protein